MAKGRNTKIIPIIVLGIVLVLLLACIALNSGLINKFSETAKTENWKTATLKEITIKHPPEWETPSYAENNPEVIVLTYEVDEDNNIRLTVANGNHKSREDNIKFLHSLTADTSDERVEVEEITLDGTLAVKGRIGVGKYYTQTAFVLSKNGDSIYIISLQTPQDYKNSEVIFDQILSTFEFTN